MAAPKEIVKLVERFEQNKEQYTSGNYNETQLRLEFLNPFFSALGWDVENRQGHAEPYKEVIHEDAIKVGTATKAPDYAFRIGGTRKFFVEAKKPSHNLKEDISPSYQLRRYAWSAKLPLSILTDFEEFAVYDCRIKPLKTDKASVGRLRYLTYTEYGNEWDSIVSVFSKDAVLKGSFDKYAESIKGKKGTAEVDDAFLKEIESWREILAKNIALRNPKLSQKELNFAVQRTIDRIIFLRICEDRGIEPYGRLQALVNGEHAYARLCEQFYRADERYNSGLFHFETEKGRPEQPDELTPHLHLDDKPLKDIIRNLYYPDCPYEFSVLPADILGQVYEQFLGKVIRLTAGHQAKVEEKPEVKKAGGVYYTPTYIVDYIVKNTVGKLLTPEPDPKKANVILSPVGKELTSNDGTKDLNKQRTDQEVAHSKQRPAKPLTPKEASKLRILDPACGSGSFLIGAYQYLLDWHRDWYVNDSPEKHATGKNATIFRGPGGEWRLTTAERKRILLNNIYGVDIDSQAVEVTKLSLLLKVLEGENEQSISQQLKMFHERALPDLGSNVKCGNSLIGPDFYEGKQLSLLNDDEKNRINVFDWKNEFKEIMEAGGFDAVIGNPPYIRIQAIKEWAPIEVEFYKFAYKSASAGNYDIYVVFLEKGLSLLCTRGILGFIVPPNFFKADYGKGIREIVASENHLSHVVHFGGRFLFESATVCSCLVFLTKARSNLCHYVDVDDLDAWRSYQKGIEGHIPAKDITGKDWSFSVRPGSNLKEKLDKWPIKLGNVAERMSQGIRTSANEVYVLRLVKQSRTQVTAYSDLLGRNVNIERGAVRDFLQGREIKSYRVLSSGKVVVIPYSINQGKTILFSETQIKDHFPLLHSYLAETKEYLSAREKGRFRGPEWYQFGRQQNIDLMLLPKIIVPDTADRASFALDSDGQYAFTSGYGITFSPSVEESPEYFLGLLNSSLLDFYAKRISTVINKYGFFRYFTQFLTQLPICRMNRTNPLDKSRHDKMVELVEQMLSLHKKLPAAKTEQEKTVIQRQIEATDRQIDELVYELYGLTEEEIKIVEAKT